MTTTCSPIMTPFPANVVIVVCKLRFIDSVVPVDDFTDYKFNIFSIMQYFFNDFLHHQHQVPLYNQSYRTRFR